MVLRFDQKKHNWPLRPEWKAAIVHSCHVQHKTFFTHAMLSLRIFRIAKLLFSDLDLQPQHFPDFHGFPGNMSVPMEGSKSRIPVSNIKNHWNHSTLEDMPKDHNWIHVLQLSEICLPHDGSVCMVDWCDNMNGVFVDGKCYHFFGIHTDPMGTLICWWFIALLVWRGHFGMCGS